MSECMCVYLLPATCIFDRMTGILRATAVTRGRGGGQGQYIHKFISTKNIFILN